jgi:hypothetical protein
LYFPATIPLEGRVKSIVSSRVGSICVSAYSPEMNLPP